jgi:hypothetical protein
LGWFGNVHFHFHSCYQIFLTLQAQRTHFTLENDINIKMSKLLIHVIALGALLVPTFQSVVWANDEHYDQRQVSPEKMHEHMKARLDKLAARLEIKASQQPAWEEYAKSVESLADQSIKKPNGDVDAATLSRYRADRVTEFAKKLSVIADATAKLQKVLTEDQRKILTQALHRHGHHHKHHGWKGSNHESPREYHE